MTRKESAKKSLAFKREPARLSKKLDNNLLTYAIAATAAGVGMAAMTPSAEAKVIATPANIPVPYNGGLVQFDVNHDGQMDFGLSWGSHGGPRAPHHKTCSSNCPPPFSSHMNAVPAQVANEVWQTGSKAGFVGSAIYCAAALAPGRHVNGAAAFAPGNKALFWYYAFFDGSFSACRFISKQPRDSYLGLKFLDTGGNTHYGWVRVSVVSGVATISGYAYETIPGKGIVTGVTHGPVGDASLTPPADVLAPETLAPPSLGMLAVGSPGLVAWRRPEQELAA
jgi:hypothetical protein